MKDNTEIPSHVAIILDGNGRWAKLRRRERTYGHRAGAANVKAIVRAAGQMGIRTLTLYAFSTENWKRPQIEVRFLMRLFRTYLLEQLRELVKDNVQVHIVGDMGRLSDSLRREIAICEAETAKNDGLVLNVAINYGGRLELTEAVKQIADKVIKGKLSIEDIKEETIQRQLYPSDARDVDLLIRTGGEFRISNFLLWQLSYSELYFTSVLWPDFTVEELEKAIKWYGNRNRRFGGLTAEGTT
ncbi:MAG: isoprenyl transferase [Dialister sp.]|nr:isoprenyl transferase [Dialister sp.]